MALVCMAVYDTEENNRTYFTHRTIHSLNNTVDFTKHSLIIVNNNSCRETVKILEHWEQWWNGTTNFELITLRENVGTARAINLGWQKRKQDQHCLKMDNDVVIKEPGWLDKLEDCIERSKSLKRPIGIIGLKRKDLDEWPLVPEGSWAHSELVALPHQRGDTWLAVVERVNHVMGTCQLYSSDLLDKVGYLYQFGVKYGFDDSLMAARCHKAGFMSCFYPHYEIDHIDPGGTEYTTDKHRDAGIAMADFQRIRNEFLSGERSIYCGPNDE